MTTQTLPRLSFAPLEGITGWVFRQVHQRRFPGLDRYYAPFFAPTTDSPLTGRGLSDLQPDHNQGCRWCPNCWPTRPRPSWPLPGCSRTWGMPRST